MNLTEAVQDALGRNRRWSNPLDTPTLEEEMKARKLLQDYHGAPYRWQGEPCEVTVKPVFQEEVKGNVAIRLWNGRKLVVPWRSLRRNKLRVRYKEVADGTY